MQPLSIARWSEVPDREPVGALVGNVDLVIVRYDDDRLMVDAALEIGVDYVILDGRGGGTGAAPALFRDHISVPPIPELCLDDLTTFDREIHHLAGIAYGGLDA